ncbi:MAG: Rieske 2Fe-2S domain-containing protein, partial [Actinobacteria bacterium]|nr:Rieske 2Fe-2S domain-containing protein [Actinomycetota bacterium]
MDDRVTIGTLEELQKAGCLTGKAGAQPVCVFWSDGAPFALDDRCPHMGFPLHRGSVESGLVTCHWHNARFDLRSGGTLDPWADDVRAGGWGAGLTVLTAMVNVLPHLDPADRPLALVAGLAFVSRDTRGRPPRFALAPLSGGPPADRLSAWYRRFIETRSGDAAERTLASAIAGATTAGDDDALHTVADMMFAAATDHVFLDGGHTIDFTNKAFEVLDHLGWDAAADVLPTLVPQTASAARSEERGAWRYPHDLAGLIAEAAARLPEHIAAGSACAVRYDEAASVGDRGGVARLAWSILSDDPVEVVTAIDDAIVGGARPEELGRALAYA